MITQQQHPYLLVMPKRSRRRRKRIHSIVHPVTHAVGNTIKRVVIIGASILVFKNPVTMQGYIGSAVAIAGVLLYSLAVEKTKKRA
eukprot:evm.model.NODE_17363_length_20350_cov_19.236412.1